MYFSTYEVHSSNFFGLTHSPKLSLLLIFNPLNFLTFNKIRSEVSTCQSDRKIVQNVSPFYFSNLKKYIFPASFARLIRLWHLPSGSSFIIFKNIAIVRKNCSHFLHIFWSPGIFIIVLFKKIFLLHFRNSLSRPCGPSPQRKLYWNCVRQMKNDFLLKWHRFTFPHKGLGNHFLSTAIYYHLHDDYAFRENGG